MENLGLDGIKKYYKLYLWMKWLILILMND